MAKSKKTNDPIPKKCLDKQRDGQTLFYRTLQATTDGPNKYIHSRLAFKSQKYRLQCWSNQKLLHHNQHAKNQLNS